MTLASALGYVLIAAQARRATTALPALPIRPRHAMTARFALLGAFSRA